MTTGRVTTVTCADDMDRLQGFQNLQEFVAHIAGRTDLAVELEVGDECVRVRQSGSGAGAFAYPFAVEDIVSWAYQCESDNRIRYEVLGDVARALDISLSRPSSRPSADDHEGDQELQELLELEAGRTERILAFVDELLHGPRWIDLDGTDLLIMDPDSGGPLELTAIFEWVTPVTAVISRPCQPANRPAVARLYCDGRLALTWPPEADDPPAQDGVTRPLRDLVVVDLVRAERPLDLYDEAYEGFSSASERTSYLLPRLRG